MKAKDLELKIPFEYGGLISRLLQAEKLDQQAWDEDEKFANHKMRLNIQIVMDELESQLEQQGVERHYIYGTWSRRR